MRNIRNSYNMLLVINAMDEIKCRAEETPGQSSD